MKRDPTQKQIRQRCKKIQEGWTEEERISRIADYRLKPGYADTWTAPTVVIDEEEAFQEYLDGDPECT